MARSQGWDFLLKKEVLRKLSALAAVAITLLLLFRLAAAFFAQPEADLISWDQAARASEAVGLAKEIHFHQLAKFMRHILSLNWWPPLHSLTMSFSILCLGLSFKSIIIPSFVAYILSVFSILFVYHNLSPWKGRDQQVEFSLLFSLTITSPFLLSSATWAMLEIFGITLTYLAFAWYFRATIKNDTTAMRICGLTGFLLWTLKYNYGLFLSIALFLSELARADQLYPQKLFSRQRLRWLSSPILYPAYLLSMLIIFIAITGGTHLQVFKIPVSLTSIYNPAMYLYQYIFIVVLFRTKSRWRHIKGRLSPGHKELIIWGALPTGIFLLLPDKIKAIIMNFKAGQHIEVQTPLHNIYSYLSSVLTDYSLFWPLGVFVMIMLCLALVNWRKTPFNLRLLMVFSSFGLLAISLGFGLVESRYVATFVPAFWIAAAWPAGHFIQKWPKQIRNALVLLIVIPMAITAVHSSVLINKALRQPWAAWAHHGIEFRVVLESVIRQTQGAQRVIILGASDLGFGPLLLLKLQVAQFENPNFHLDIDPPEYAREPKSIILEGTIRKDYDMIILFIVERGKLEGPLRECSRVFRESAKYHLLRKESFVSPMSCQILFFAEI